MLLQLNNVRKSFTIADRAEPLTVLDNISLQVDQGRAIGITGPSGSGKSTLLNIVGALDKPDSGQVLFAGRDLSGLSDRELARIRNREIGFIFQLHHLLPQCTVMENVLIPAVPLRRELDQKQVRDRAEQLLERVGLKDHRGSFPAKLSGGERQRTAVVRALINKPRLILADEPTGSLDLESSRVLGRLLMELNRDEKTALILVTHSAELASQTGLVMQLQGGHLQT